MSYSETIEERNGYRVRLSIDEYADPPYDCSGSPILRIDNRGYGRGNPVFVDTSTERPHQEDDYIINAIDHWQTDPSDQDWPLFEKYLRAFFGVRDIEYYRSQDYWYVTYDSEGWRDSLGFTDEESKLKHAHPNMEEYKAWCEGDVYYYVVEKRVHWTTEDETIVNRETDTWEEVDSCGGFYGSEYAREAALEAFVAEAGEKV